MAEESIITEKLRNMVGVEAEPEVFEVEKGHIRRFAEAVGDPNPLWQDEAYARKSRYGSIIAPPMFLQDEGKNKFADRLIEIPLPVKGFLNGGVEIDYYQPMKPGDVITTQARLVDVYEKEGKAGKLVFMIMEVTFKNQRKELVCRSRNTFIRR
jgi:acyl dehydratase